MSKTYLRGDLYYTHVDACSVRAEMERLAA